MTMAVGIAGAAYSLFRSQSRGFSDNVDRFDTIQNARSAMEESERVIRTMGAGTPNNQPMLVYGANDVLAFNTDYIEQTRSTPGGPRTSIRIHRSVRARPGTEADADGHPQ